jgi:hypothetical protein
MQVYIMTPVGSTIWVASEVLHVCSLLTLTSKVADPKSLVVKTDSLNAT